MARKQSISDFAKKVSDGSFKSPKIQKTERSGFEKELQKAVHAHNEKIRYHEAKGAKHMPDRQSFSELKKMMNTKQDYIRTINELRSFGTRGAEAAVKVSEKLIVTAWEKNIVEKQAATVTRSRRAKKAIIDKLDVTNTGKKTGFKRGETSGNRTAELVDKKVNWERLRSRSELEMLKKTLKFQTTSNYWKQKDERVKLNYIQGLFNTYGPRANGLIEKISKMPTKQFMKTFNGEQNATISFMYEPLDEDTKLDALSMIWLGDDAGDLDLEEYFEI